LSEASRDVLARVDSLLAGKELVGQARAFLLLRLCQLSLLFSPDEAERYWSMLVPLQGKVSKEFQADLEDLRSLMELTSVSGVKGFAAEVIADVVAAKRVAASDVEEAKRRLRDCESRLEKRRLPMGKAPVRIALMEAWGGIDRLYALQFIDTIPEKVRESIVLRMNRAKPLLADEWKVLAEKVGREQAVRVALKILEDEKPGLLLPRELVLEVGAQVRNSMRSTVLAHRETELASAYSRYARLVNLQVGGDQADLVPRLLEELYLFFAEDPALELVWAERFTLIPMVLELGVLLKLLTGDALEGLLMRTPSHLVNFVRAHHAALTVSASEVEDVYTRLLGRVGDDRSAEAWFLVTLVGRGLGAEAMSLAQKSGRAEELLPRLRRAWLCTHPETSRSAISAADMAGDPVGEFLAQGGVQDRLSYLRSATDGGRLGVPGAMWAGVGTEAEPEGLRGFWKRLTSTKGPGEVVREYLALNPLYSSYQRGTKKEEQFAENLRMSGYGEYRYDRIDSALLETLIAWGDVDAAQVRSVLRAMWGAIRPDDELLRSDWLRNAVLTRCRNVFAADPGMLLQDFLGWVKKELVDKGRTWQVGRTQFTLKFPDTVCLQFCVISAMTVGKLSPSRRDQILLSGIGMFKGDPATVEAAAQIYNAGKQVLDLTPPPQLKRDLVESWQLGVVKNAIPVILGAMAAQASG